MFCIFIIIAVLSPFVAIYALNFGAPTSSVFQRSGSLVIVFSLVAEYYAVEIFNILKPSGGNFIDPSMFDAIKIYYRRPITMSRIVLIVIAIGTLICGYGDGFCKLVTRIINNFI